MKNQHQYDTVVIGSGQAGNPLAGAMAKAGRRTALVERELIGGSCVNYGCTPTKTMIRSAGVAHLARRAGDFGVHAGPVSVDLPAVLERKRRIVERSRDGARGTMEELDGLDLIFGEARFAGPKTLEVTPAEGGSARTLTAETIIIDTGQRPAKPPIAGLDRVPWLDSTSIMEVETLPAHLVVLGGGYIGIEFAQMFRRFGSRVTIVQRGGQLLPKEDSEIAEAMLEVLRDDGIDVLLDAEPTAVEPLVEAGVRVTVRHDGGDRPIEGSHLLVATGRTPNTDRLGLEAAGIASDDRGFVTVDDRLATNVPGVYAVGDVKGGPAFTHISYDDYRILKRNLLEGGDASIADRIVCYTIFTDPQLGRVGLTEREARDRGIDVRIASLPARASGRAVELGETHGLMKAVVDAGSGRILGGAILAPEGGELMGALQVAMIGRLPYTALRDAPFAHPTLVESFNSLFKSIE